MRTVIDFSDCENFSNPSQPAANRSRHPSAATRDRNSMTSMRVDGAHTSKNILESVVAASLPETLAAIAGRYSVGAPEQMERQAAQLSERLQQQHREMDQREAEFHARAAQLENELRTARLLNREREAALQEKHAEYQQSVEELRQRNADMVAAQAAMEKEAEQQVKVEKTDRSEVRRSVELWQKKLRELERNERQLQARLADAHARQKELEDQTERMQEAEREQNSRLGSERAAYRERFESQLAKLQKRGEELDRRSISIQQLHAEIAKMYRDVLEIRMATEDQWSQVCEKISPAEATQRMAEFRRTLTDQFELASQSLAKQRQEIAELVGRLAENESRLTVQREELRGWVARRQSEIEEQAERLLARERELDMHEANLRHAEREWQKRHADLEQEIRRLRRMVSPERS